MHCSDCGYNCHEKCAPHVPKNCTKIKQTMSDLSNSSTNVSGGNISDSASTTTGRSSTWSFYPHAWKRCGCVTMLYVCIYVCCMYASMYVCIYIFLYVCIFVFVYVYICLYVCSFIQAISIAPLQIDQCSWVIPT